MKVLLVNGSPNAHGCTDAALQIAAAALEENGVETEIFWIGSRPIGGCIGCGGCRAGAGCVLEGPVNDFVEKAAAADGFIFGSPVHYAAASGNLTSFLDRVFFSAPKDVFRLKPGAAVVSARRAGTTAALEQLNKYMGISEMPLISSCYWNMVHGSKAEDVKKDEEGVRILRTLGNNMAYFLKCRQAARQAGIELPKPEPRVMTSFIR